MSTYPKAIQAPWKYQGPTQVTYFKGTNKPAAVVLHIMAGWAHTAVEWAAAGYDQASWHFTVARDGTVYQHLDFADGGYQAGAFVTPPVWKLWRGASGGNINNYTLGVEHEGFPGEPFTPKQAAASRDLCHWLAVELHIPLDEDHFPAHAVIDTVNRPNDFNTPALRTAHYAYLFEDEDMKPYERGLIYQAMAGDVPVVYEALAKAGFVPRLPGLPNDGGIGDMNGYLTRRFNIMALSVSDNAEAAYALIA